MTDDMEIRHALEADAADIAELIFSTSVACCFTPEQPCPEWYAASVKSGPIAELIRSAQTEWLVAIREHKMAGVLAVRDKSQVKYFFVDPSCQKLGIGKQLWQFASRSGKLGKPLTVRSSLFAVPVYESLGFVATEAPGIFNGMHYQAMATR
ncbi:GNAT family N-acetyltransferase [Azohydromonas australica]|uniref:GNAT family N-acetyltransferase n=1 Tax=Azohydromonas australica TaxID=364039 RepID=UPI000686997C|nr:GNAT family N-acetyltransferase [Azohydromonas australica]